MISRLAAPLTGQVDQVKGVLAVPIRACSISSAQRAARGLSGRPPRPVRPRPPRSSSTTVPGGWARSSTAGRPSARSDVRAGNPRSPTAHARSPVAATACSDERRATAGVATRDQPRPFQCNASEWSPVLPDTRGLASPQANGRSLIGLARRDPRQHVVDHPAGGAHVRAGHDRPASPVPVLDQRARRRRPRRSTGLAGRPRVVAEIAVTARKPANGPVP